MGNLSGIAKEKLQQRVLEVFDMNEIAEEDLDAAAEAEDAEEADGEDDE